MGKEVECARERSDCRVDVFLGREAAQADANGRLGDGGFETKGQENAGRLAVPGGASRAAGDGDLVCYVADDEISRNIRIAEAEAPREPLLGVSEQRSEGCVAQMRS